MSLHVLPIFIRASIKTMLDEQWLHTLGNLTSQLLTIEYSESPDDAKLLGLLKQAHVMHVQLSSRAEQAESDERLCTGPCLYLSPKPNKQIRQLVMAVRCGEHVEKAYTKLVEFMHDTDSFGDTDDVALCAVTGVPCQRNTTPRVSNQLVVEAARVLQYAQQLVKSRVLELEAQEELQTSLQGGASMKALIQEFQNGNESALVHQLLSCVPCDEALRNQVMSNVTSVDAVLRPLVNTVPPRMRHQANLVKHAFAKRWGHAALPK